MRKANGEKQIPRAKNEIEFATETPRRREQQIKRSNTECAECGAQRAQRSRKRPDNEETA
jgi:hypothetical protein